MPRNAKNRLARANATNGFAPTISRKIASPDHRIEVTLYNLPTFIEGKIDSMIEPLMAHDVEEKLKALKI
jgi:hypothetical protein